jgi:hypothetical protein
MTKRVVAVVIGAALLAMGACGGGDDEGSDGSSDSATTTSAATKGSNEDAGAANGAGELPKFSTEFDRVCKTQVGFPGATAYEKAPGTHPVMFFEEFRGESYVSTSRSLPEGWAIKEDTDYEDNGELAAVQLVACSDRVKTTPTGNTCDFDDDGKKVSLELVDSTWELKVYEATTGKQVGDTATLEAKSGDCPYIAAFRKGDTTYVVEPSDDDYINALKEFVAVS